VDDDSGSRAAPAPRLLAIGDIHGCHVAFDTLLEHLSIVPSDTVVVLGDVIDRGPGTLEVIERLIQLRERCRLVFIMGNHEQMFLESLENRQMLQPWLEFGGLETLMSYGERAEATGRLPADHVEFLRTGVDYFENASTIFVHANLEPGRPLATQTAEWLRWTRFSGNEQPWPTGQRVICGHTAQKSGRVWVGDGWVCIDTCAYGGEFLTALDVGSDLVYQARQTGEFRGPISLAASTEPS
jgi:serine/threonine protein phosphatase 1